MAYHHSNGPGSRQRHKKTRANNPQGMTSLANGQQLSKAHLRIDAIGDIDELNCQLGVILAETLSSEIALCLKDIQHSLFEISTELNMSHGHALDDQHVQFLKQQLAFYNATLPPLRDFILPGGTRAAAACYLARSICRRAERHVIALSESETLDKKLAIYLNQLADLLFVIARGLARQGTDAEVQWQPRLPGSGQAPP